MTLCHTLVVYLICLNICICLNCVFLTRVSRITDATPSPLARRSFSFSAFSVYKMHKTMKNNQRFLRMTIHFCFTFHLLKSFKGAYLVTHCSGPVSIVSIKIGLVIIIKNGPCSINNVLLDIDYRPIKYFRSFKFSSNISIICFR